MFTYSFLSKPSRSELTRRIQNERLSYGGQSLPEIRKKHTFIYEDFTCSSKYCQDCRY